MSVSRVHHCIGQKRIVRRTLEPSAAPKCKCRKFISLREATQKVKDGNAEWAVTKRIYITESEDCAMCATATDQEAKTCGRCGGKGEVPVTRDASEHSNDIVLIGQDKAVYEKPKTPRTATIESEHLELAYSDGLTVTKHGYPRKVQWDRANVARDRIEEYGKLILDARAYVGPLKTPAIVPEPADNWRKGEGPTYDYGWGVIRACTFENNEVIEEMPVKDHPSLEGQANFEASTARASRLAELMKGVA